jgi:hypothetical protein
MLKFDIRALIARFGGIDALHYAMKAADMSPPGIPAMRRWRRENTITTVRLAQLATLAERQGSPLNLNDYLKPDITKGERS